MGDLWQKPLTNRLTYVSSLCDRREKDGEGSLLRAVHAPDATPSIFYEYSLQQPCKLALIGI